MSKKSMTFEASIARLDEIVKTLEGGQVSLEESVKLFEEGAKLSVSCEKLLKDAELKVSMLMNGPEGPVEQEMDHVPE